MKKYFIYRHLKPCGEVFYIGIGYDIKRPFSKRSRNKYWKNVVNKHGYEVEILAKGLTEKEACELERILILWYGRKDLNTGSLVNLTDGGEGILNLSQESRLKMSKVHKGKIISKEQRKKLSNIHKGRKATPKQKINYSNSKKGSKNPMYGKRGVLSPNFNKPVPDHVKKKISNSNKGRHSGGKNPRAKLVLDTSTGIIFYCAKEASEAFNISYTTLLSYLNGNSRNKTNLIYI